MQDNLSKTETVNWGIITGSMHENGYAVIPRFLNPAQCEELKATYNDPGIFRKTVVMERYRFGLGEYKYYDYPLPGLIQQIRDSIYPKLVPIANSWMSVLKIDTRFPNTLRELHALCRADGQLKPTPLILKYSKGGYNTLHQDLYGDLYFPIQLVLFLNEPGEDFKGGEFILIQQHPRAQSKAVVLNPKKGDLLAFTTNFRPVKGSKGYYRANMKHGVSEVRDGERYTVGIIFHDALS
ncbi:MAG TPA: 2OG-Fe(II) oxygenase [Pedobacter sp.]|uniref:2OG-Fe(II) oxygenase n=1 Tax=Pedobacter sp. TaxID=1411316 RepID=UPI002D034338|nr:2OG-Fe(II) oxygenase [Pedobacter sp.]HMI05671.1 2OG-Fe(II) oxygenase [Pedobacter sp.]